MVSDNDPTLGESSHALARIANSTMAKLSGKQRKRSARSICAAPPQTERAKRQRVLQYSKLSNPVSLWRWLLSKDAKWSKLFPLPPPGDRLSQMGIVLQPLGFPAGFTAPQLGNYDQILDAFSHCFFPGLFQTLGIPDPYAAWPYEQTYWDGLFQTLQPSGFRVQVDNANGALCFGGVVGDVQESPGHVFMQLFDCSGADTVMHEIGHVVMDYGIMGRIGPLYYHHATGDPNRNMDAIVELNRLFGNYSETRHDAGVKFGFVSAYALTSKKEDFAETFMYYVYFPSDAFDRAARQQAQGSTMLADKLQYIAYLYKGLSFADGGVVANWPGYPL